MRCLNIIYLILINFNYFYNFYFTFACIKEIDQNQKLHAEWWLHQISQEMLNVPKRKSKRSKLFHALICHSCPLTKIFICFISITLLLAMFVFILSYRDEIYELISIVIIFVMLTVKNMERFESP